MNKKHISDVKNPEYQDVVSRKLFIQTAIGGMGLCYAAALGYPVYRYLASPVERAENATVETEKTLYDAQKIPPGSMLMFKFASKPAILIHHKDDTWTALTAVCTHLGCTVQYEPEKNRIYCSCHGGTYDPKTGGNVSGPPPKPLKKYNIKVTEKSVIVSKA